jgi:hypothetical protein
MRLSRLLSKHSADAANIQKSNSVNHSNLCATIWKVRIFEGTLQFEILVKKAPLIKNDGRYSRHGDIVIMYSVPITRRLATSK